MDAQPITPESIEAAWGKPSGATAATPTADNISKEWGQPAPGTAQNAVLNPPKGAPDRRWSAEGSATDWRSWAAAGIRLGTKVLQSTEEFGEGISNRLTGGLFEKGVKKAEKVNPAVKDFEPQYLADIRDHYTKDPSTLAGQIDESVATFLGGLMLPGGGGEEIAVGAVDAGKALAGGESKLYAVLRSHGLKVTPQEIPVGGVIARTGKILQKVAGKIDTDKGISYDNVEAVDRLIKSQFKLEEGSELNPQVFDSVIEGAGRVYEEARSVKQFTYDAATQEKVSGFGRAFLGLAQRHPEAYDKSLVVRVHELRSLLANPQWTGSDAVDVIKALRANAREALQQGTVRPQAWLLGSFERNAADILEDTLGQAAGNAGIPQLAGRLREARKTIAQAHDAQSALLPSGHFSAPIFARMQRLAMSRTGRTAGLSPLSGYMRIVADGAATFPRSFMDASKAGKMEVQNVGKLIYGAGMIGAFSHSPALMALAASEAGARAVITTRAFQPAVGDAKLSGELFSKAVRFLASRPAGVGVAVSGANMTDDEKDSLSDITTLFGPLAAIGSAALAVGSKAGMKEQSKGVYEMQEASDKSDNGDGGDE